MDGASGLVALRAEQVSDAILVPRTAVMGSQDNGVVGLIRDGNSVTTRVELGATDGNLIQVTSGLNAGDTISAVPPALESQ
ncbi:hypothetical protein JT358_09560 [Micrococcales bacterium 31B]|nr:hypothetical protein [Micrococcales bacterium 31B]